MSWASRRRNMYVGSVLGVVLIVLVWIVVAVVYEPPTCFDGKKNGDEAGVDCGGTCERVCSFQAVDPIVLWSRFFERSSGLYNVAVLIENPNANAQARSVPYTLKLRDAQNILVAEVAGVIDISPERLIPLFISSVDTGERVPVRSTFTFDISPVWEQVAEERPSVSITDTVLTNTDTQPRLDAMVHNRGLETVSDITLVALLYDASGNAVNVSQTVLAGLAPDEMASVVFTWPSSFGQAVASIDVIPVFQLAL